MRLSVFALVATVDNSNFVHYWPFRKANLPTVVKTYVAFRRLHGVCVHEGSQGLILRRKLLQEGFVRMEEATLP